MSFLEREKGLLVGVVEATGKPLDRAGNAQREERQHGDSMQEIGDRAERMAREFHKVGRSIP